MCDDDQVRAAVIPKKTADSPLGKNSNSDDKVSPNPSSPPPSDIRDINTSIPDDCDDVTGDPFSLVQPERFNSHVFEPIALMQVLIKEFWSSHSCLRTFAQKSLHGTTCTVQEAAKSLWPIPPVRWSWMGASKPSPRRRRRRLYHAVRAELLNLVLVAFNWMSLGFIKEPPAHAQLGASISVQQHSCIERIEDMLDHFCHAASFKGADLGRASSKFSSILQHLKELPKCRLRVEDLVDCLSDLQSSFYPYKSHFAHQAEQPSEHHPHQSCEFLAGRTTATAPFTGAKPVESARVKWDHAPSFHADEFLGPLVKQAFQDPEVLRLPESLWPESKPAKMHTTREEFLKLVNRWDALGACRLFDACSKDFGEAVGIFCVDKDHQFDRLIINPKTINGRMASISDATKDLAPGAMLSLLSLEDHECFRFSADDLTDYYYTFHVSDQRCRRNIFRMKFQDFELEHLQCFDPSLKGKTILVGLATLAMGDSLAVEVAQQSHAAVLRICAGAMDDHECLRYRSPIPRSSFVELLAIDDHVGIQKLSKGDFHAGVAARDTQVFRNAEVAYKKVGLVQHEKKRKRNVSQGTILGADFDGMAGRVMAPRERIAMLSILTMHVVLQGTATRQLLSILTGCWIHVLLFRRPLFCIMDTVFSEGSDKPQNEIFCLSGKCRSELQLLAIIGPTAQADLRVGHSPNIYCTDASPDRGAVIVAATNSNATAEIWRHCEQRGFYTKLQSPVSEILQEKGIEPLSDCQFVPKFERIPDYATRSIPPSLDEGILFDCIEIFRGSGNWSEAHEQLGLRVHPGIELDGRVLRVADMGSPSIFHELLSLAHRRVVRDWHAGVPCISFGTLRRPQVRSKACPAGFNPDEPFTKYHNMLARRTAFILTVAMLLGQYISVEQPGSSRMFLLHCYKVLVMLGCVISHFCFCHFGSAFQKPSKWLHNKPWLIDLECKCDCPWGGNHFVVQGSFNKESIAEFKKRCRPSCKAVYGRDPQVGEMVSKFSGAYPFLLVQQMASGLSRACRGKVGRILPEIKIRSLLEVGLHDFEPQPSISAEPVYPNRPWFEDPEWISELCDSLEFKECFRYRFKKSGHINVNEARTYKSFLKAAAKTECGKRVVGLLDSRVTIGAASKGRSSSFAISRILQGAVPYVIGSGLYPGLLHCYSDLNRSDGPSRGRAIAPPTKDFPAWFSDLCKGQFQKFDAVVASSRFSKNPARWLRLLLMLSGDIEPNPGPTRGPMDLNVGFVKATADRMAKCLDAFVVWLDNHAGLNPEKVFSDERAIAWALRGYGLYCFEQGLPRYLFVNAITAVQDQYPSCRSFLNLAWQIDRKWQQHEPGMCRAVLPEVVIRAAAAVGALWGWTTWTAIFLLGFAAMLHPSEMLNLTRRDLVFPSDLHSSVNAMYLRVRDPKTARFARRQHSRIDDVSIIAIAEAVFGNLPLDQKLYHGSMHVFRRQWNCVMDRLGIPFKQKQHGATPGVLRGSGATFYYCATEDLAWVAWRGRWSRVRTLEFYLQEVGSQMLIHELDSWAKARVFALSDACGAVLCRVFLQSSK